MIDNNIDEHLMKISRQLISNGSADQVYYLLKKNRDQLIEVHKKLEIALEQQGEYRAGRRDTFVLKAFETMFSDHMKVTLIDAATMSIRMADLLIEEMDKVKV